jgi:hypothetical protein
LHAQGGLFGWRRGDSDSPAHCAEGTDQATRCGRRGGRVIVFGKAATRGLPRSTCDGLAEPPSRQAAKEWIADPEPHIRTEPASNPGVWPLGSAVQRSGVTQRSGCSQRFARKTGLAQTHSRSLRFCGSIFLASPPASDDDPRADCLSAGAVVSGAFNGK